MLSFKIKDENCYSYQLTFRLPVQRDAINSHATGTIIPFNISLYHCQKSVSLLSTISRNISALFGFQQVLVHVNGISQRFLAIQLTPSQFLPTEPLQEAAETAKVLLSITPKERHQFNGTE